MEKASNDSIKKQQIRRILNPKEEINLYHEEYQIKVKIILKNDQKTV